MFKKIYCVALYITDIQDIYRRRDIRRNERKTRETRPDRGCYKIANDKSVDLLKPKRPRYVS